LNDPKPDFTDASHYKEAQAGNLRLLDEELIQDIDILFNAISTLYINDSETDQGQHRRLGKNPPRPLPSDARKPKFPSCTRRYR